MYVAKFSGGKVPPCTLHISVPMPHRDKIPTVISTFSEANFTNGPEFGQPSTLSLHGNSRWLPETGSSCDRVDSYFCVVGKGNTTILSGVQNYHCLKLNMAAEATSSYQALKQFCGRPAQD